MGKSSINGPFSMAMLNNQMVDCPCSLMIYCTLDLPIVSMSMVIFRSISRGLLDHDGHDV